MPLLATETGVLLITVVWPTDNLEPDMITPPESETDPPRVAADTITPPTFAVLIEESDPAVSSAAIAKVDMLSPEPTTTPLVWTPIGVLSTVIVWPGVSVLPPTTTAPEAAAGAPGSADAAEMTTLPTVTGSSPEDSVDGSEGSEGSDKFESDPDEAFEFESDELDSEPTSLVAPEPLPPDESGSDGSEALDPTGFPATEAIIAPTLAPAAVADGSAVWVFPAASPAIEPMIPPALLPESPED